MSIRTVLAASFAIVGLAAPLPSQAVPTNAVLLSASAALGGLPVASVHVSRDTLEVAFTDVALTSAAINAQTWTLGRTANSPSRTPKQAGQSAARALWAGWARTAGVKSVVIAVQAAIPKTDPAQVRLFYTGAELSRR